MQDEVRADALHRFFAPSSIALIGASPDKTKIRGRLMNYLRRNGYAGRLLPVNPSYRDIDGLPCHASIAAIGAPVDLAIVAIPASGVVAALEECAAAGARHALVVSSGFAEEGGAQSDAQAQIVAIAKRTGMRICGPNAEGFHNDIAHVSATFSPAVEWNPERDLAPVTARRVGVIAQSGGVGFALFNRGRADGLRFSKVISTGNEADLSAADFFAHMVDDPDTDAILMFLESIRDPALFAAAAARAAKLGKPVLAVKVGRSQAGVRAAASHTASMAGWDAAYDALFAKYGIATASDPDEAVAIMAAFVTCPPPRGKRAAIVTVSGGAGAWMADTLSAAGFDVPELSPALQRTIAGFIPSYGSARNPIDITAQAVGEGGVVRCIELLLDGDEADVIVITLSLTSEHRVTVDPDALRPLLARQSKPVLFFSYTRASDFSRRFMGSAGAPVYTGLSLLSSAIAALRQRAHFIPPETITVDPIALDLPPGALAEHRAKAVLAAHGVPVSPHRLVCAADGLDDAARDLGFPLVAKIQSADILHKTEAGGVRLGIADLPALHQAYAAVLANAALHAPQARIDGVLLERMVGKGVEIIVGVIRDPVFGPVLMLGAGGVTAELFRDVTYSLAPVDAREATIMLRRLRSFPLLDGFRGAPRADIAALAELVARISRFAAACQESVREVELNPVIVHPVGQGCSVADALLLIEPREPIDSEPVPGQGDHAP
jgi:acyl-CoA synthetase (NDP forming)